MSLPGWNVVGGLEQSGRISGAGAMAQAGRRGGVVGDEGQTRLIQRVPSALHTQGDQRKKEHKKCNFLSEFDCMLLHEIWTYEGGSVSTGRRVVALDNQLVSLAKAALPFDQNVILPGLAVKYCT